MQGHTRTHTETQMHIKFHLEIYDGFSIALYEYVCV